MKVNSISTNYPRMPYKSRVKQNTKTTDIPFKSKSHCDRVLSGFVGTLSFVAAFTLSKIFDAQQSLDELLQTSFLFGAVGAVYGFIKGKELNDVIDESENNDNDK